MKTLYELRDNIMMYLDNHSILMWIAGFIGAPVFILASVFLMTAVITVPLGLLMGWL